MVDRSGQGGLAIDHADIEGYEAIFVANHTRLLRLALLLCNDRERAIDATAEAFAKVYPRWRAGLVDDVAAYLRTSVANELRHLGRREVRHDRAAARLGPPGRDASAPPSDAGTAERHRLLGALQALPDEQRITLVMRFYVDLTEVETAAALGVPIGTVKSRTARALSRLRAQLEERDD